MPEKEPVSIAPAEGKLGVLIPGMGAVTTTFIAGVEAIKRKLETETRAEAAIPAFYSGARHAVGTHLHGLAGREIEGRHAVRGSVAGASYSQRSPRFRVRLRVTFQSSCTYALSDLLRSVCGPVYCDLNLERGQPEQQVADARPVKAPVKSIWPRRRFRYSRSSCRRADPPPRLMLCAPRIKVRLSAHC